MTDSGSIGPLSLETVGHRKLLDGTAVEAVLKRTGLPLREGFDPVALMRHLNELIDRTLFRMFTPRYSREEHEMLRRHLLGYEKLSRELSTRDIFPPRLPKDWYDETMTWFEDRDPLLATRSHGGQPEKIQISYFYPRAIGLFASAFGVAPVSTTRDNNREDGSTARFLRELLHQTNEALAVVSFDDSLSADELAKLRDFNTSDAALKTNIIRAMRRKIPDPDDAIVGSGEAGISSRASKVWQVYKHQYDAFQPIPTPR